MDKKRTSLVALATASFLGCSTDRLPLSPATPSLGMAQVVESVQQWQVETSEPDELTLPSALALALDKSPELESFAQSTRVGEARILQAGIMPNPEVSLTVEDVLGTGEKKGVDASQTTLMLGQVIELGEKRAARIGVASAFGDQLNHDYELKRVEVLSSLTDKFIRTSADEKLLELAKKGEALASAALTNIQKRTKAGGVSELEETKAGLLFARARIATEHAEHELLTSKRELAAFWGSDSPKFAKISTNLFQRVHFPTYETLAERVDQSPEIRRWANEKRLREAELKLAEAKRSPNVTVGGGPRHIESTGDQGLVFQLSIPLNIFDQTQGERQEAAILRDKVSLEERAARLRLRTTLFGLYQEAKHVQTVLDSMAEDVLPQAERSLRIAESGYDQGRFSYLDLADAQRTLLEVSRENIEAAYSYHSFINAIERLLGAPLATTDTSKSN